MAANGLVMMAVHGPIVFLNLRSNKQPPNAGSRHLSYLGKSKTALEIVRQRESKQCSFRYQGARVFG